MKERYLVTGANGFIGSHIVDLLVRKGYRTRVLLRHGCNTENIEAHVRQGNVEVFWGDLRDPHSMRKALKGISFLLHSAALTDLSATRKDLFEVNVHALKNMITTLSIQGIKRFIHISSIGTFDKNQKTINEETPLSPVNDYECSKTEGESLVLAAFRESRFPATILEPSAVYGPRVNIGFPYMLEVVRSGRMRYPVDEKTLLNLLYVTDLVHAVELSMTKDAAIGERFIIGGERSHTYKEVIELTAKELGVPIPKKHVPTSIAKTFIFLQEKMARLRGKRPRVYTHYFDYITHDMVLDITKAKRILGYTPEISLERGVKEMVTWFLKKQ
jgi:dihydroflavonol-4-reductase